MNSRDEFDPEIETGILHPGTPGINSTLVCLVESTDGDNGTIKPGMKVGRFGKHVVYCDEPESSGGHDEAVPPLGYFVLAVGW